MLWFNVVNENSNYKKSLITLISNMKYQGKYTKTAIPNLYNQLNDYILL